MYATYSLVLARKVLPMDWSQIIFAISGVFGTGGIGTYFLANQRIKHNSQVNKIQIDKLHAEFDASIARTQLQMIESMRQNMEHSEARAQTSELRVSELTALLNQSNIRIAKLELCIVANNLQLPL